MADITPQAIYSSAPDDILTTDTADLGIVSATTFINKSGTFSYSSNGDLGSTECDSLTGWDNTGTGLTTQTTFDGKSCFRQGTTGQWFSSSKDLGTFSTGDLIIEGSFYLDSMAVTTLWEAYTSLIIGYGDDALRVLISVGDGLGVNTGSGTVSLISGVSFVEDTWYEILLHWKKERGLLDIYIDNVLVAYDIVATYTSTTDGTVNFYTQGNSDIYWDYVKVGAEFVYTSNAPTTSRDAGTAGDIRWDSSNLHICDGTTPLEDIWTAGTGHTDDDYTPVTFTDGTFKFTYNDDSETTINITAATWYTNAFSSIAGWATAGDYVDCISDDLYLEAYDDGYTYAYATKNETAPFNGYTCFEFMFKMENPTAWETTDSLLWIELDLTTTLRFKMFIMHDRVRIFNDSGVADYTETLLDTNYNTWYYCRIHFDLSAQTCDWGISTGSNPLPNAYGVDCSYTGTYTAGRVVFYVSNEYSLTDEHLIGRIDYFKYTTSALPTLTTLSNAITAASAGVTSSIFTDHKLRLTGDDKGDEFTISSITETLDNFNPGTFSHTQTANGCWKKLPLSTW